MSQSPWIKINGKRYSHKELESPFAENNLSDFEKSTIKFCQAWLTGQQEFTLQTSGSTGAPKPIVLLRSQMEASAQQTIEALELKSDDTALVCLDTKYIAGQMMLVRSLIAGMNIIGVEPSANPLEKTENSQIDFAALVPYQLENIIEHAPEKLNQVRCAIIGGAAISNSLKEKIKKSNCALFATYGMTETISHIALQRLNGGNPQDSFEAFPTINLRLDNRGCLCIKTNYLKEEVITNDLVELVEERKFKWLGRIDNVINSGGIKVIPEKIELTFEKIFNRFQIKNRFFITGLANEKLGNQVSIIIEGPPFTGAIQKEILVEATRELTKYELPKEFLFAQYFIETATGKINRSATVSSFQ
jgi:O-succinylbenzoic acid--CoA ligase